MSLDLISMTGKLNVDDADLSQSRFTNANLSSCTFHQIALQGARFTDSDLAGIVLNDVNLAGSKIHNADLSNVEMSDCRLDGATIDGIRVADLFAAYRNMMGNEG